MGSEWAKVPKEFGGVGRKISKNGQRAVGLLFVEAGSMVRFGVAELLLCAFGLEAENAMKGLLDCFNRLGSGDRVLHPWRVAQTGGYATE